MLIASEANSHRERVALTLKVILFGPTSLGDNKTRSGPKSAGTKWGLRRVTPGAIALAAVLVILFVVICLIQTDQILPVGSISVVPGQGLFAGWSEKRDDVR